MPARTHRSRTSAAVLACLTVVLVLPALRVGASDPCAALGSGDRRTCIALQAKQRRLVVRNARLACRGSRGKQRTQCMRNAAALGATTGMSSSLSSTAFVASSSAKTVYCWDTDGTDTGKRGSIAMGAGTQPVTRLFDTCKNGATLIEYSCRSATRPHATEHDCVNGCERGACLAKAPPDACGDDVCTPEERSWCDRDCFGSVCGDGVCAPNEYGNCSDCPIAKTCVDSDLYDVPTVRGSVRLDAKNERWDYCPTASTVLQLSCGKNGNNTYSVTTILTTCPRGCKAGECLP